MVEVNRNLYLDPVSFEPNVDMNWMASDIKSRCVEALLAYVAPSSRLRH